MERQYRPRFRKQLTGTPCGHANCNMAAAAHFADRQTLGLVNKSPDEMRMLSGTAAHCLDRDPSNDGTNLRVAATALSKVGIVIDLREGMRWSDIVVAGKGKLGMIAHTDYDQVPRGIRGDKEFLGLHSVYAQEYDEAGQRWLVYDSLDDGRADQPTGIPAPHGPIWWPSFVLRKAMEAFPGPAMVAAFITRRMVTPSVRVANIRAGTSRSTAVIARAKTGQHYETGGVVHGERIGGDNRWYRVFVPGLNKLGYLHATVAKRG